MRRSAAHFDAAKQLMRRALARGKPRYTVCYALMALKDALRYRDAEKATAPVLAKRGAR